ncbi:hypothetical protein BHE74_00012225 [Ensete ventricosum]|nr:hypothetical protein GW17_00012279 [Ensete ventricosum]RWW79490.1 hypothetical protein BHE74_00012225 [Ensete ventricosum]RZR98378.1 hypothetical protein BHM03_00027716 [Ensete ventricosum]
MPLILSIIYSIHLLHGWSNVMKLCVVNSELARLGSVNMRKLVRADLFGDGAGGKINRVRLDPGSDEYRLLQGSSWVDQGILHKGHTKVRTTRFVFFSHLLVVHVGGPQDTASDHPDFNLNPPGNRSQDFGRLYSRTGSSCLLAS